MDSGMDIYRFLIFEGISNSWLPLVALRQLRKAMGWG
jgi:hypothetical protein